MPVILISKTGKHCGRLPPQAPNIILYLSFWSPLELRKYYYKIMSEKADHENLEEEDEDEDEEEEPKLKYSRIGSALLEILKEDAASCMVVHPKVSNNLHYFLLI